MTLEIANFLLLMGIILSKVVYKDENQLVRDGYWYFIPVCIY